MPTMPIGCPLEKHSIAPMSPSLHSLARDVFEAAVYFKMMQCTVNSTSLDLSSRDKVVFAYMKLSYDFHISEIEHTSYFTDFDQHAKEKLAAPPTSEASRTSSVIVNLPEACLVIDRILRGSVSLLFMANAHDACAAALNESGLPAANLEHARQIWQVPARVPSAWLSPTGSLRTRRVQPSSLCVTL